MYYYSEHGNNYECAPLNDVTIGKLLHSCFNKQTQAHRIPYLHISSIFLHITNGDTLITMDGDSPSLVDITLAMVTWITPMQLVRVT